MRSIVPFRAIPHQSELFLQYVEGSPEALAFYRHPPTLDALERAARAEIVAAPAPRREVAAVLRRQNQAFGSSPAVLELIDSLEHPESVAVVTGQQAGLFGGPLYTVFKAMTAARLAAELRGRGIPAVPIFWMDAEDHDLAEVARFTRLGPGGALERVDARPALFPGGEDGAARPVGAIPLPGRIEDLARELLVPLPGTPAVAAMAARLAAAYRPGLTFSDAFARLVADLLREFPIALFDPHDPGTKPLLAPLFRQALLRVDALHTALDERNRALERAGFHTQVHVAEGSTVLFLAEGPERRSVARQAGDFVLKGSTRRFTAAELLDLAERAPERFSPNVLLRPIVQDTLFPTAAYVAGPAEVAYFAQVAALYGLLGRPMPVVWPRASLTLLGHETWRELDDAGLELEDCMAGKHRVVEKLVAAGGHARATAIIKRLAGLLETGLAELRPAVVAAEASLGAALDTAERKVQHQIAALETKLVHFEARHDQGVLERADALLERCYPERNLQERQLGIVPIAALHGDAALGRIGAAIDLDRFAHRILDLG